jgi:beta-glucosidase
VSLRPGQTKRVTLHLTAADASAWSSDAHAWQLTPGTYTVHVGDSSAHLPLSSTFTVRD